MKKRQYNYFCYTILLIFSVYFQICLKFLEISDNWSGVIRFGFTYNDPSTLRYGLPKYACPDLTNKPGYWVKALPERFSTQSTILYYYVTSAGDVHFGINGEEKGIFFSGVETRGPLWALIDVYGNSTAVEFVDIRHQLNNSRRTSSYENSQDEVERIVCPMQQISIHQRENQEMNLPVLRHQPAHLNFTTMPLHRTKGRNVRFNNTRSVASRVDNEFCQGYIFTGRPLQIGERVVVQILATEQMFEGCLGLGLTSCDPSTLQPSDLPDDSNFLLDRLEYWVISRDLVRSFNVGDEISFCISPTGEVQISKNGAAPYVVIHVDQSLKLWAFFDIYGSTRKIRVLSSPSNMATTPTRHSQSRIITPTNSESMNSLNSASEMRRNNSQQQQQQSNSLHICCVTPADIQVHPSTTDGPVLSVKLRPTHANIMNQNAPVPMAHHHSSQTSVQANNPHSSHYPVHGSQHILSPVPTAHSPVPTIMAPVPSSSSNANQTGTMMSSCSSTYIEVSIVNFNI